MGENIGKLSNAPALRQLELIDLQVLPGFREGLKCVKNIEKLLIIPAYKDEVLFPNFSTQCFNPLVRLPRSTAR